MEPIATLKTKFLENIVNNFTTAEAEAKRTIKTEAISVLKDYASGKFDFQPTDSDLMWKFIAAFGHDDKGKTTTVGQQATENYKKSYKEFERKFCELSGEIDKLQKKHSALITEADKIIGGSGKVASGLRTGEKKKKFKDFMKKIDALPDSNNKKVEHAVVGITTVFQTIPEQYAYYVRTYNSLQDKKPKLEEEIKKLTSELKDLNTDSKDISTALGSRQVKNLRNIINEADNKRILLTTNAIRIK